MSNYPVWQGDGNLDNSPDFPSIADDIELIIKPWVGTQRNEFRLRSPNRLSKVVLGCGKSSRLATIDSSQCNCHVLFRQ
jgi:hypothetical protein